MTETDIFLAAIEREDLDILKEWRNNPELRQYFREYKELSSEDQGKWYDNLRANSNVIMFTIKEKGSIIGACGLTNLDWKNRTSEISLYIGEGLAYIDKRAKEALDILVNYAFNTLNLYRLYAEVYEFDTKKYTLLIRNKFQEEGILKGHIFHDGTRYNSIMLGRLNN